MDFISPFLDGSFGWDLRDLLRQGEDASARIPQDEKVRHLQKVDIFANGTKEQPKAVAAASRVIEAPAGATLARGGTGRGVLLHPRRPRRWR